jgi:hypothetical protein
MQRRRKPVFPTIERLCFLRGPCKNKEELKGTESSFETPACRDMSFGVKELN